LNNATGQENKPKYVEMLLARQKPESAEHEFEGEESNVTGKDSQTYVCNDNSSRS